MHAKRFEKPPGLSDIKGKYIKKKLTSAYSFHNLPVYSVASTPPSPVGATASGHVWQGSAPAPTWNVPASVSWNQRAPPAPSNRLPRARSLESTRLSRAVHRVVNPEGVTIIAVSPEGRLILPDLPSAPPLTRPTRDILSLFMAPGGDLTELPSAGVDAGGAFPPDWPVEEQPILGQQQLEVMDAIDRCYQLLHNEVKEGAVGLAGPAPNQFTLPRESLREDLQRASRRQRNHKLLQQLTKEELDCLLLEISRILARDSSSQSSLTNKDDPLDMQQRLPRNFRQFERYLDGKFGKDGKNKATQGSAAAVDSTSNQPRTGAVDSTSNQPRTGAVASTPSETVHCDERRKVTGRQDFPLPKVPDPISVDDHQKLNLKSSLVQGRASSPCRPNVLVNRTPTPSSNHMLLFAPDTQAAQNLPYPTSQVGFYLSSPLAEQSSRLFPIGREPVAYDDEDEPTYQNLVPAPSVGHSFSFPNVAFTQLPELVLLSQECIYQSIRNFLESDQRFSAPLPLGWSEGRSPQGRLYFASDETRRTTWHHPVLSSRVPFGWERVDSSREGVYYHNLFVKHSQRHHPNLWMVATLKVGSPEEQPAFALLRKLQMRSTNHIECFPNVRAYYKASPSVEEKFMLLQFLKLPVGELEKLLDQLDALAWQELRSILVAYETYRSALVRARFNCRPPNQLFQVLPSAREEGDVP